MSDYRQIVFYVNVDTTKFINEYGGELTLDESPHVYFGEHVIFCIHFVNGALDPYPFSVTDSLGTAIDNNFLHTDPLMCQSDNDMVNVPGDWDLADRTLGRMSVRINCNTDGYETKIGTSAKITSYAEIKKTVAGIESVLLQGQMNCHNVIDKGGSGPLPLHDYYDVDESDSRYQLKDIGAVSGNIAEFDAVGNTVDSGLATADVVAVMSDVSNKADKVLSATEFNFAGLSSLGNLIDSGWSSDSFAPLSHNHFQSQSHEVPDTDLALTSLHHTIGTNPNQAASGSHTHIQTQSHNSPDTDVGETSLHHTIGTGAYQASAGNHNHSSLYADLTHASRHKSGGADLIKLDEFATPDNSTVLDSTISQHGLLPRLSGSSSQLLDGTGNWRTIASESPALKAVLCEIMGGF